MNEPIPIERKQVTCSIQLTGAATMRIISPSGTGKTVNVDGAATNGMSSEDWSVLVALFDRAVATERQYAAWDFEQREFLYALREDAGKKFIMDLPEYEQYFTQYRKRFGYIAGHFYMPVTVEEMLIIKQIAY